jgi:hypothetical protein
MHDSSTVDIHGLQDCCTTNQHTSLASQTDTRVPSNFQQAAETACSSLKKTGCTIIVSQLLTLNFMRAPGTCLVAASPAAAAMASTAEELIIAAML